MILLLKLLVLTFHTNLSFIPNRLRKCNTTRNFIVYDVHVTIIIFLSFHIEYQIAEVKRE